MVLTQGWTELCAKEQDCVFVLICAYKYSLLLLYFVFFFVWNVFSLVAPLSWSLAKTWEFAMYFLYTLAWAAKPGLGAASCSSYLCYSACWQEQEWIQADSFVKGRWEPSRRGLSGGVFRDGDQNPVRREISKELP